MGCSNRLAGLYGICWFLFVLVSAPAGARVPLRLVSGNLSFTGARSLAIRYA